MTRQSTYRDLATLLEGTAGNETVPCKVLTLGIPGILRDVEVWQSLSELWRGKGWRISTMVIVRESIPK